MTHQFEFVQHLGEGTYGSVDLVRRRSDARLLIMKMNLTESTEEIFMRETKLMQRLFRFNNAHCHPYVSCYAGSGHDPITQRSFLLMALNGMTYEPHNIYPLMAFLDSGRRLTETHCMKLTYELLEGVLFIHDAGIAHGDLHANNIMVQVNEEDYSLYIIDFGMGCDDDADCSTVNLKKAQDIDWMFVGITLTRLWQQQRHHVQLKRATMDFLSQLQKYETPMRRTDIANFAHTIAIWLRQNGSRASLRQTQRRLTFR